MHRNVSYELSNGDDRVERRFPPPRWPFLQVSNCIFRRIEEELKYSTKVNRQHLTDVVRSPWNVLVVAQEPGLLDVLIHACVSKLMMGNGVFDEPRARVAPWD